MYYLLMVAGAAVWAAAIALNLAWLNIPATLLFLLGILAIQE